MAKESSTGYNTLVGQEETFVSSFAQRTIANSAEYLRSSLEPHMKVLDVGCGPGSITIELARRVPNGHVTGIDTKSATATLERARAQAAKDGVTNVEFTVGDALALPFPDDHFDVTHAHQVLQHLTDPVGALREMRRVTKPGGIVACREAERATLITHPHYEGIAELKEVFDRMVKDSGREVFPGRKLHFWARRVGFEPSSIKSSASCWCYRTPEERAYWATPFVNMSTGSEFAEEAVRKGYVTAEELKQMGEAWRRWMEDEDGFSAIMNVEMLARV